MLEERLEDFGARTRQSQPREGGSERAKCAAPGYRGLSLASRAGPSHGPGWSSPFHAGHCFSLEMLHTV